MRCTTCHHRYSASWAQPAPGGTSAPGVYLIATLTLLAVSIALLFLDYAYAGWTLFTLAWLVGFRIPIALADCRGRAGGSEKSGETCPQCGRRNPIRPWSL